MLRKLLILSLLLPTACTKKGDAAKPGASAHGSGAVVASYDGRVITADEIMDELKDQSPFVRSRYQTLDKKKEFLESMVRLDLLSDEAKRDGMDKDDEVIREYKKALITEWMRHRFNDKTGIATISDADSLVYYNAHKDDYSRPDRPRIQIILFKGNEDQAKIKAEADRVLKDLTTKSPKNDSGAFANVARTRSDDAASKTRGGDIDFHTHDEIAKLYGESVASAVDKLKLPNDLSPVVRGTGGWYLLRLEARQPAFERSFEQVKSTIQARLWNEKRNQLFEQLLKELKEKAHLKIDETELAKIDVTSPGTGDAPHAPTAVPPPSPPKAPVGNP